MMAAKIPVATDHNNESGFLKKSILKGKEDIFARRSFRKHTIQALSRA